MKEKDAAAPVVSRLPISYVCLLQSTPVSHVSHTMKQAVHPKDTRSLPRVLVWISAAGIVGTMAYHALNHADASASQRTDVVKTKRPPGESSSSLAKTVSQNAPIVLNEREQYATLGKEGLGVKDGGKNEISSNKE
eukprot:scaffold19245_cov199-Amphora_coffeaeformis.AAC.30